MRGAGAALRGVDLAPVAAIVRPIGLFAPRGPRAGGGTESLAGAPAAAERARTFFLVPKVNEARLGLRDELRRLGVSGARQAAAPRARAKLRGAPAAMHPAPLSTSERAVALQEHHRD